MIASAACSPAEVAAYADTRACSELGLEPVRWDEVEEREVAFGVERSNHSVVLVFGKAGVK